MRLARFCAFLVIFSASNGAEALIPSSSSPADDRMHSWCESVGIEVNPSVRLLTTPESVAGRGVFAIEPLVADELIASIPTYAMFHPRNARNMFPQVAARIEQQMKCPADDAHDKQQGKRKWIPRWLRRVFRRKSMDRENHGEEPPWQLELTEYALAAVGEDHPFSPWIQQWQRDDPVQRLFDKGSPTEEDVKIAAAELHKMVPDVNLYKILAALNIRLEEYESLKPLFAEASSQSASMYATVTSRTIGLSEDITGVVPFHDMLNHNFHPSVGLGFSDDGKNLELFALKNIAAGEELFLCYTAVGKEYTEDASVWMLVQWGIPVLKSEWKVADAAPY